MQRAVAKELKRGKAAWTDKGGEETQNEMKDKMGDQRGRARRKRLEVWNGYSGWNPGAKS